MEESTGKRNFIRDIIDADREAGKHGGEVVTRFPPEPNGYLHIGHAKSICLNFGLSRIYGGPCHLRFDDTNPSTEESSYVESIQRDIKWLGFDWEDKLFFASDYFEQLYAYALSLIDKGLAYVCSLSESEIREYRGSLSEAGKPSPYRDRSVSENRDLFARMRAGEFADGEHVLRAKIDMSASNMKMRDPLLYRIRNLHHYRTGDKWPIYPMYDFAHCLSDAIEGITHSICTLEFENNRELYDWIVREVDTPRKPNQYEFARLNLDYTVMSKRKLLQLVNEKLVQGWDDPRMPTLAAFRRRGVPAEAIRNFCEMVGVAKSNSIVDFGKLEYCIRDHLNTRAPRVMCVLDPLRVILSNYDEGTMEELDAPYFPADVGKEGSRSVPFSRELYIERSDFAEDPPKGFHRLVPGGEVRLRYGYVVRCDEVIKDESGAVQELRCTYDPATLHSNPSDRKVKGVIHWVSAAHGLPAQVRLYDRLFRVAAPDAAGADFREHLNSDSLKAIKGAIVEPSVAADQEDVRYQFERQGYFWRDPEDSRPDALVFNRVVGLRDSWAAKKKEEPSTVAASPAPSTGKRVRPPKKSRSEQRALARERDPFLADRHSHYLSLGLEEERADVLSGDPDLARFFDEAVAAYNHPDSVSKWLTNRLLGELKDNPISSLKFTAAEFARLVELSDAGTLGGTAAKKVHAAMHKEGGDPESWIATLGLDESYSSDELKELVLKVLAENDKKVTLYKGGKKGLMGFFMGQVMQSSQGKARAADVQALLRAELD